MIYNKNSKEYLGSDTDITGRSIDGYLIDGEIHIVYDYNTEDEWVSKKNLDEVISRIDEYLFTPYAIFAAQFIKPEDVS